MANLQFGDKWNTSSQSPQKNTIVTAFLRTFWYWGEGWEMSISDFNSTLEEAFTLIYECIDKYPHYSEDDQNQLTRLIVRLTDNVSNVKMALVRQKGAYMSKPNKDNVRSALDESITYVDDTLADISKVVAGAGINQKIEKDNRARKHKVRNPVIIGTRDPTLEQTKPIPIDSNNSSSTSPEEFALSISAQTPPPNVVAPPPPAKPVSKESDEDSDNMEVF
jgi:hypothetical protein